MRRFYPFHCSPQVSRPLIACGFAFACSTLAFGENNTIPFDAAGPGGRFRAVLEHLEGTLAQTLVGYDRWDELIKKHGPVIEAAKGHAEFGQHLNEMFGEAKISHLHYYHDTDWRYWLFSPPRTTGAEPQAVDHIGLFPQRIGSEWFVRGVLEGTPAASSELLVGDRILSVDGDEFDPFLSFQGKSQPVVIKFARSPDDFREVSITPVHQSLLDAWMQANRESIRVIDHGSLRLAYMHVWIAYDKGGYDQLAALQNEVSGLILDFREGYGGSTFELSRLLLDRSGQEATWQKPAVILTSSDGTRSAKEIVAAEARAMRKVRLVGTQSAGAVLPCVFLPVGSDGLLVKPMHWHFLEGQPLQPDMHAERDIRYCAGKDPQLEKGMEVLADLVQDWRPRSRKEVLVQDEIFLAEDPRDVTLGDKHSERLLSLPSQTANLFPHKMRWEDVDGDGARELLGPNWHGTVEVVSSDGAIVDTIDLQGIETGKSVGDIVPATINGLQYWFLGYWAPTIEARKEPVAALFTQRGDRVWQFQPELPDGVDAEMSVDAGDLDQDSEVELVIGLRTYTSQRSGLSSWTMNDRSSYLFILDAYGELLCQQRLQGSVEFVEIVQSKQDHPKPILLVGSRDRLQRFSFSRDEKRATVEFED